MVKRYYVYDCSVYYIYGQILLHLWLKVMVTSLWLVLHLWSIFITFMVGITFTVFITFMGDTVVRCLSVWW